tara:strand:+ start:1076 stop:1831 length:756 start_codon:yes stop_codon:yes gene_type:complete
MAAETLTFSDDKRTPGWPSFYTFYPEYIKGMNGYLYTFKNGNLYRHNTNSLRNNYYGTPGISTITSVFNPEPTLSIKLFKTMSYESDDSWTVTNLNTDLSSGSMLDTYFEQKEGEWYSYIRSNAGTVDWKLRSANGLGSCLAVSGPAATTLITFTNPIGNIISIGDIVYVGTTTPAEVGPVISVTSNSITVDASAVGASIPVAGNMILYYKNSIAESHGARGYYMEFTMTNDNTAAVELFSVGSSVMKSYP